MTLDISSVTANRLLSGTENAPQPLATEFPCAALLTPDVLVSIDDEDDAEIEEFEDEDDPLAEPVVPAPDTDEFEDFDEDDFDDDFDDDFEEELDDDYEIEIDDDLSNFEKESNAGFGDVEFDD